MISMARSNSRGSMLMEWLITTMAPGVSPACFATQPKPKAQTRTRRVSAPKEKETIR